MLQTSHACFNSPRNTFLRRAYSSAAPHFFSTPAAFRASIASSTGFEAARRCVHKGQIVPELPWPPSAEAQGAQATHLYRSSLLQGLTGPI